MTKKKISLLIIVTIGLIISIVLLFIDTEKFSKNISAAIATFGLLSSYLQFLYNNWNAFFIWLNKCYSRIKGDTVSWKGSYKFYTNNEISVNEIINELIDSIKLNIPNSTIRNKYISDYNASFILHSDGYDRNIELFIDNNINESQIRINYSSSTSYKDSKIEIENFEKITDLIAPNFQFTISETSGNNSPLYSVVVSFSKFNPFYRLTLKHLEQTSSLKFTLEFNEDDAKICINNKALKITTKNKDTLKKVLNDYVALSSIGIN